MVDFELDFLALCSGSRGLQVGFWLIHGGSRSVAGWLVVGLWGGLPRWWWVFCPFRWCWGVFYFLFFYVELNTVKYFLEHFFGMQPNTEKKLFSLKSFASENILHWKIFYNETNEA